MIILINKNPMVVLLVQLVCITWIPLSRLEQVVIMDMEPVPENLDICLESLVIAPGWYLKFIFSDSSVMMWSQG